MVRSIMKYGMKTRIKTSRTSQLLKSVKILDAKQYAM